VVGVLIVVLVVCNVMLLFVDGDSSQWCLATVMCHCNDETDALE